MRDAAPPTSASTASESGPGNRSRQLAVRAPGSGMPRAAKRFLEPPHARGTEMPARQRPDRVNVNVLDFCDEPNGVALVLVSAGADFHDHEVFWRRDRKRDAAF